MKNQHLVTVTNKTIESEELSHWLREAVALRVGLLCHGKSLTSGGFLSGHVKYLKDDHLLYVSYHELVY